jgi:hypothetical protein
MPIYERPEDLTREEVFINEVAASWNADYHKLPIRYQLDYLITTKEGHPRGWVEIKCRNVASDLFETYILGLRKFMAGSELARTSGLPFILIVKFRDRDLMHKFDPDTEYEIQWGGRNDREDDQDMEPVIHIPIASFSKLYG